jgi:PAS domain S-box-containing protein
MVNFEMTTPPLHECFNALIPFVSNPFCILDTDLCVKYASPPFLALFPDSLPDVIGQPADQAFRWDGPLKDLPCILRRILVSSESIIEYPFFRSGSSHSGDKTTLALIPIRTVDDQSSRVTGIVLAVSGITSHRVARDQQSHETTLINIIHEIAASDQISYPGRLVQQVVSRVGSLLQIPFISFLEFTTESDYQIPLREEVLWSRRYGFLIGEGWDGISSIDLCGSRQVSDVFCSQPYLIHTLETVPIALNATMLERGVSTLLIIPVLYEREVYGCFILWNTEEILKEHDITALKIIGRIVGAGMMNMRVETDLAQSREKFRSVIEHIGDMYYRTDKAGILLEISPSMATALGYQSSALLIGLSMEALLMYPDNWPIFLSEVLNSNGVKDYELILKGAGSKVITGSVSCRLVYTEDGDLLGIEGVIRDISRRKQYEHLVHESEWKLEQAGRIAKLGLWSYDVKFKTFRVSPEVFSILGFPSDMNVITLGDLIHITSDPDKNQLLKHFLNESVSSGEFGFDIRIDLPAGKFKYIRIHGQPRMREGAVTGSFGILQDITERKEVEQHLLRYANQLEQKTLELDAMRSQLLDMNRDLDQRVRIRTTQIEELLRQKDEFIMQIGHDLKTPLTPLVAILPYVRKKISDPELIDLLNVSIEDVKTIRRMLTKILELARMNALYSLSDLQQINLHEALDQIISDNTYLIHQKSLLVRNEIPDSFSLMISPMHLETLMGNLIGNAVKYSYIDGSIIITAEEKPESICIRIKDNGIGIPADALPRIFDEFYKADSSRHDLNSHGLGLAIARRIVDIYGGIIKARSEGSGKGSTFLVNLKKIPEFRSSTLHEQGNF